MIVPSDSPWRKLRRVISVTKEAGMEKKTYLGDSVYARFDGFEVVLYLDNGLGPTSEIIMEPEVVEEFLRFISELKKGLPASG